MKIISFGTSTSSTSINQSLIRYSSQFSKHIEVISLRDYSAPVFSVDLERESGYPEDMVSLARKFDEADGFLISTAEHNGSVPAAFKNAIDWVSRESKAKIFRDKPMVILSASPGSRGGASAKRHLLDILPFRGAEIVGHMSIGHFNDKFKDGEFEDLTIPRSIEQLIKSLEETILSEDNSE